MPCADPMLHCWLPWHALCCVVPRCACALRCTHSAPLCPTACPLHCIPLHSNLLCSRQSTTPTSFASLPTTGPRSWPAAAVRAGLVAVVQLFSAGGAHHLHTLRVSVAHVSTRMLTSAQHRMPGCWPPLLHPASLPCPPHDLPPGLNLTGVPVSPRLVPTFLDAATNNTLVGCGQQGCTHCPLPTRVAARGSGPRVNAHEPLACSSLVQLALLAT